MQVSLRQNLLPTKGERGVERETEREREREKEREKCENKDKVATL